MYVFTISPAHFIQQTVAYVVPWLVWLPQVAAVPGQDVLPKEFYQLLELAIEIAAAMLVGKNCKIAN